MYICGGGEVKKRTNFFRTPPLLLSVVGKTSLRGVDGLRNHDCSFNNLKVKYQSRKTELWIKRLFTIVFVSIKSFVFVFRFVFVCDLI